MEQTYIFLKRKGTGYLPFSGLYAVCEKRSGSLIGAVSLCDECVSTFQHNKFIVGTNTKPKLRFFVKNQGFPLGLDEETKEYVFLVVLNSSYEEEEFFIVPLIRLYEKEESEILLLKSYEDFREEIQEAIPDIFHYYKVKTERPRRGTKKPEL